MKKTILILFIMLVAGFTFQSCKPSDSKLQKNIETEISAMYPEVRTAVSNGVATLSGTVETAAEKTAAEDMAKKVKNVKSVINNINVVQLQQQPEVAVNSDATLNNTIRSGLYAAGFNDVNVDVRDGEVYLTGNVKRADLEKVMQIANEANPKRVVNELIIK